MLSLSIHAAEELDDDNLTILDLENIILTGVIIERQRDRQTREVKCVIRGFFWFTLCHKYGIFHPMKTTIDAGGRLVVPKALRQALGLKPVRFWTCGPATESPSRMRRGTKRICRVMSRD